MALQNQYEAFEAVLKEALPGTLVFQANMPFSKMDELARAASKVVTYLFFQDTERVTTSGKSGVHDAAIEVNLFGPLNVIDQMATVLSQLFLNEEPVSSGWTFSLVIQDKKDIWEPDIKAKRIWIQYKGLMIEGVNE